MPEPQSGVLTNFTTTAICFIILSHLDVKVKLYNVGMIEINDKKYEVNIERKRIRNIYLRVDGLNINVTCPYYVPKYEIYKFIDSKKKWIYNCTVNKFDDSKLRVDDHIYYKGKLYKLVILKGTNSVRIDNDTIYIRCKKQDEKDALKVFYEYGKKIIKQYVIDNDEKYLNVLKDYGYEKQPIYNVKYLKSMWGCCYSEKNIVNLSVRLIHYDPICIEAILWHELLHFIIPNHSKRFHQVLEKYMPKYKQIISTLH